MDDTGERSLARVGMLARLALPVAIAGSVIDFTSPIDRAGRRIWVGGLTTSFAVAMAVLCLVHGARHDHERGRWWAVAAIVVGLAGLLPPAERVHYLIRP